MWTAVSGASAQAHAVDTVANNLANADTLGFKKDVPTFKEYLAKAEKEPEAEPLPHGPITNRDLHPLEGRDQAFVAVTGTVTNFRQGPLKVTHSPLDLALDGNGFLEVSTPQGVRYTRQGSLKMATDGRLVTNEGYPVLAAGAQPTGQGGPETQGGVAAELAGRFINLRDRTGPLSFTEQGEVYAGDELVARLSVAEFADPRKLRKTGGQYFENWDPGNRIPTPPNQPPQKTIVRQGVLEGSNVNPVEEMTKLIQANRMFEHDMKSLKTYGEIMQKEANDIGKL